MPNVVVKGSVNSKSCGHSATGSKQVFAESHFGESIGVARAGVDKIGGLITGGSSTVYVEGVRISIVGDIVADHGKGKHNPSTTTSTCGSVFAGK